MIASLASAPRGPTAAQAAAHAQDAAVLAALRMHTSPGGPLRPAELAAHLPGLSAGDVAASLRRLAMRGAAHRHQGPDGAREYRASEGPAWRSHAL
jgi:DNA-binding HxlR family transcriptional regulator